MPSQAAVTVAGKVSATITNTTITNANAEGTTGVIPTSVAGSGVSVSTNGSVTVTAATAASINGCFTSSFDKYVVIFDLVTSAGAGLNITLRASGTDSATGYDSQRGTFINATAAAAQSLAATSWVGSGGVGIAGARHDGELILFNPDLAVATTAIIRNAITTNPMTTANGLYQGALGHQTASAYDGITFTPASGTITGTVYIYGYNKNL